MGSKKPELICLLINKKYNKLELTIFLYNITSQYDAFLYILLIG